MISRWNYLAITTVMLVVFFMFQFTNVALESWDGYEENSYYLDREDLPGESSAYQPGTDLTAGQGGTDTAFSDARSRVVYIGAAGGAEENVVYTWAVYTKQNMNSYASFGEYKNAKQTGKVTSPEMLIINSDGIDWNQADLCGDLEKYVDDGVNLVFCNLPDAAVIDHNVRLQKLLGIEGVKSEETEVEGIYLREGFLLGGEAVYRAEDEEERTKRQDLELTFPWYALGEDAEVYMRGITKDVLEEEEDYPPVVWSSRSDKASVFAVNGSYMEDITGLGILTAMEAKSNEYELYPVVNAQNMVLTNYPNFASENNKEIKERYGQSMAEMSKNLAWPSLVAVYRQNTLGLTCMLTPQYDYEDEQFPNQTELQYYMRRLREQGAEAGLSSESVSDTGIQEKLTEDQRFMEKELPDYRFSSFYAGSLTESEVETALNEEITGDVRTIVTDYSGENDIIGYQSEEITRQSILSDGTVHTYRDDLRMRSVQTALGYSSVSLDMSRVAFPENDEETLEKVVSEFGGNIGYYWDDFRGFAGTTVSECDSRIRSFLALDYTDSRKEDTIHLELTGTETPVWFVLRTEGERIVRVDGGSWEQLEDGAWLIEAESTDVSIELE